MIFVIFFKYEFVNEKIPLTFSLYFNLSPDQSQKQGDGSSIFDEEIAKLKLTSKLGNFASPEI